MPLTLDQLTTAGTKETWRDKLLAALQGRFHVTHAPAQGTGQVTTSGNPTATADVVVKIATSGERGVATYQVSTNGGSSYGLSATVPSGGGPVLVANGVSVTFSAGPSSAGTSFIAGDLYSFSIAIPSLRTTSWQPGSTALTIAEMDSDAMADRDELIAAVTKGGFNELAEGPWLTLLARNVYDNERILGLPAAGTVRLSCSASAGPYTLVAGQVWVSTAGGKRYVNTAGGTLASGGTLNLAFQAETTGASFNVSNNTITVLVTALAGVTCNNPDPGSGSWLTTQGSDDESDAALRARNRAKWTTIGVAANADGYVQFAKDATASGAGGVTQVTRGKATPSATVPGQVDVVIAGVSGAVGGSTVSAVQAYIDALTPLTSVAVVASAANKAVTITATVKVKAAQATTTQAAAEADLAALASGTAIGASEGLPVEFITAAIVGPLNADGSNNRGITNLSMSAPAADTVLAANEVPTFTLAITWTPVA
jgi:hypothetical protein